MRKDLHEKYVESLIARLKKGDVAIRSPNKRLASSYDGPPPVGDVEASVMANERGFEVSPLDTRIMKEVPEGEGTPPDTGIGRRDE